MSSTEPWTPSAEARLTALEARLIDLTLAVCRLKEALTSATAAEDQHEKVWRPEKCRRRHTF